MKTKFVLKSKTMIVNAIIALGGFIPQVQEFATANPQMVLTIISVANLLLRMITKDKIALTND